MSILNNLFPPIVDTYQAGFLGDESVDINSQEQCTITFKLSPYTSWDDDIKTIWFTIVDPKTNKTKLSPDAWPAKVGAISKTSVDYNADTDTFSFTLRREWIVPNYWVAGDTYKIQLRFCSLPLSSDANPTVGVAVNSDKTQSIVANSQYFSEWSTITLITPVEDFNITYTGLIPNGDGYFINPYSNTLMATVDYGTNGKEYLDSYELQIYKLNNVEMPELYSSSGIIAPEELNQIHYHIPLGLRQDETYIFEITTISNNLYKRIEYLKINVSAEGSQLLPLTAEAIEEPEAGRFKITIRAAEVAGSDPTLTFPLTANFIVKRSSDASNFTYWEDILIDKITIPANGSYNLYDYTADSGILYKYVVLKSTGPNQHNSHKGITTEPKLMLLDDIFINGNGRQLKIKFNPTINTYQHTVLEAATQTIGGKYPIIRRNGNLNYRQIGISGLITYHMDSEYGYEDIITSLVTVAEEGVENAHTFVQGVGNENLFVSKEKLLHGYENLYNSFNETNNILPHKDFILERKFREEVTNFLLDGEVKLFRSPTEAPALVRLMNVSVTPNAQLGRMVYTFSATAHEIADCTAENILTYNIQGRQAYEDIVLHSSIDTGVQKRKTLTVAYDAERNPTEAGRENLLSLFERSNLKLEYCKDVTFSLTQDGQQYAGYKVNMNTYTIATNTTANTKDNQILVYYKLKDDPTLYRKILSKNTEYNLKYNGVFPQHLTYLALALPEGGVSATSPVTVVIQGTAYLSNKTM